MGSEKDLIITPLKRGISKSSRVTVSDLAKASGVSVATVSYVLSERKDVSISEATRAKVLKCAEELGYRRNGVAAALRTGRTNAIGLLLPTHCRNFQDAIKSPLLSETLTAISLSAAASGFNTVPLFEETDRAANSIFDGRVDGVIHLWSGLDEVLRSRCEKAGLAYLPFGSVGPDLGVGLEIFEALNKLFDGVPVNERSASLVADQNRDVQWVIALKTAFEKAKINLTVHRWATELQGSRAQAVFCLRNADLNVALRLSNFRGELKTIGIACEGVNSPVGRGMLHLGIPISKMAESVVRLFEAALKDGLADGRFELFHSQISEEA